MNVCVDFIPISSQPTLGPQTWVNVGVAFLTVETDMVDTVWVIEVVTSGTTVNHISPVSVVVDANRPASIDGNAPIQEHTSDSSDLSKPDSILSTVSHGSASLCFRLVVLAEGVVNVVKVVLETIDSVDVIVIVLVGTPVSVIVLDITSRAVTTPSVATPSADVQYAEAAEFEARQE